MTSTPARVPTPAVSRRSSTNAFTSVGAPLSRILGPRSAAASRAETADSATLDLGDATAIHDIVRDVDADLTEAPESVETEDVMPMEVE